MKEYWNWLVIRKNKYVSFGFIVSSFVFWAIEISFWHWSILIKLQSTHKPNYANEGDN